MFVNVAEQRSCRNVRYSRIGVARGALWDGKESQMPGYTFQERSVYAQIPFLEGQGSLLCGSTAAFIFAVVTELGLESCSEPFWELKADPAPHRLSHSSPAALELTAGHCRVCPALDICISALERVQKCWQSPELSPTRTLLPLPRLGPPLGVGEQQGAPQCGDSCCGGGTGAGDSSACSQPAGRHAQGTGKLGISQEGRP